MLDHTPIDQLSGHNRRIKNPRTMGRALTVFAALAIGVLLSIDEASAVPSFAMQTGQPCAACHVGGYGPQLRGFGRDFKLYGYTATDGQKHTDLPLAVLAEGSFTNTNKSEPGNVAHEGPNDNLAFDMLSFIYGGRVADSKELGAYVETQYNGVNRQLFLGDVDVRHAHDGTLFDTDAVYGITMNNNPTRSDIWNSTPSYGFPYVSSRIAKTPAATTTIDNTLDGKVMGLGGYTMLNDWVYAEVAAYKGLTRSVRNATGVVPVADTDSIDGLSPYWRLAVQHDLDELGGKYFEIGTYGLGTSLFPKGNRTAGTDNILDTALDANYQYALTPEKLAMSDVISSHATLIHESLDLGASKNISSTNAHDSLDAFRADVSYSWQATLTPSIQYFKTWGTNDANQWNTNSGSPNSSGWVTEISFTPWGKPDSPVRWLNGRLTLQYVAYDSFDGSKKSASDNNTIFLAWQMGLAMNRN